MAGGRVLKKKKNLYRYYLRDLITPCQQIAFIAVSDWWVCDSGVSRSHVLRLSRVDVDVGSSFFFSSRRRHTRLQGDWSSDVCSSDLGLHRGFEPDVDHRLAFVLLI